MRLRIVTPAEIRLDAPVARVVAEGPDGAFGLLPRHVDFVSQLVASVLVYEEEDGTERYAGLNAGTLVKCGDEVLVATRNAVLADDLPGIRRLVAEEFRAVEETERKERAALARLELEMLRRFRALGSQP